MVAFDEESGRVHTTKTPSTPRDPSIGFLNGVRKIARQAGFSPADVVSVAHGTTVATNALLSEEGSLPGLGLIVTAGFRHILEIARQSVPQGYGNSYFWVKPDRIVPLHLVREVTERADVRGDTLVELDVAEAAEVAEWFRERGVSCVGVCFLHAYANPAHEQQVRDVLKRIYPDVTISLSSDVLPEYREYERAVTTLVDAFVKPRVSHYVAQIETGLRGMLSTGTPFYIMKSNGGVVSASEVGEQPISTLLSGPAAGALGAAMLATRAGFSRVLTLDGGGTSTDVSAVDAGQPHVTTEGRVGRYPVKIPMIDVATVGAGGGSIARRAQDGRLRVGPESAGADPGPMCYGRGGAQPTLTDAALILGRIPPHLLGGEIPLDTESARAGLDILAKSLGLTRERAAEGILEIAAWNQANAVRQVTVKRGLDVRDYVLVAFGGSGPLQAGKLVDILGLPAALIPPDPGNVSAFGLLTVDIKNDYVSTAVQRNERLDIGQVAAIYERLESQARTALIAEGFASESMHIARAADMRYFGQAWEVRVDVPPGSFDRAAADVAVGSFHDAHERAYGYSYAEHPDQHVEWVNFRVVGTGPIQRPALEPRQRTVSTDVGRAATGTRPIYFDGQFTDTPIYARALLEPGDGIVGPAIVEEFGSTTVIFPRLSARVDEYGNLILERSAS